VTRGVSRSGCGRMSILRVTANSMTSRKKGAVVCLKQDGRDEDLTGHCDFLLPSLIIGTGEIMANYAIMRIEKRKLGAVGRICKHNERLKTEYKSNPDIDPERSHLNYHLVTPKDNYRKEVLDRITHAGARMRKDSVAMQDCFIGATPEWIRAKPPEEQREYFEHAVRFFENHFGKENIISAVVHMDEATPHMHLCFVPLTRDGRLSSKELIGGPKGLTKLQDQFYVYMQNKYLDITRGIPARISKRTHIPVYMYKNAGMLYDHYEEILKAINDIGVFNSGKKKEEAIALLGRYAPEMAKLKDQLKVTDEHISYLERTLSDESENLRFYRSDNYEKELTIKEQNQKLYELNQKQKQLEKLVSRIPPDYLEQIRKNELKARKERSRGWDR